MNYGVVVGAGPAGLKAAEVLASNGKNVIINPDYDYFHLRKALEIKRKVCKK